MSGSDTSEIRIVATKILKTVVNLNEGILEHSSLSVGNSGTFTKKFKENHSLELFNSVRTSNIFDLGHPKDIIDVDCTMTVRHRNVPVFPNLSVKEVTEFFLFGGTEFRILCITFAESL